MFDICIPETTNASVKQNKRMPFKAEEDERLRELVQKYGDTNWKLISSFMPNRSVRQCRERWNNNLSSKILKDKWSPEEDELLKQKYYEFGPKWKLLETFFPGRTSYNIRNRWSCIVRLWNIYSSSLQKYQKVSNHQHQSKQKNKHLHLNKIQYQNQKDANQYEQTQMKTELPKYDTKKISNIQNFESFSNQIEEFDDSVEFDDSFFQDAFFDVF